MRACLGQALDNVSYTYPNGERIELGDVTVTALPVRARWGTSAGLGMRIAMTVSGPRRERRRCTPDVYGYAVGRDQLLTTFAVGAPFPAGATERAPAPVRVWSAARSPAPALSIGVARVQAASGGGRYFAAETIVLIVAVTPSVTSTTTM